MAVYLYSKPNVLNCSCVIPIFCSSLTSFNRSPASIFALRLFILSFCAFGSFCKPNHKISYADSTALKPSTLGTCPSASTTSSALMSLRLLVSCLSTIICSARLGSLLCNSANSEVRPRCSSSARSFAFGGTSGTCTLPKSASIYSIVPPATIGTLPRLWISTIAVVASRTKSLTVYVSVRGSVMSIRWCGTPCICSSLTLSVPIFKCLYTCLESAEITSPSSSLASLMAVSVLPLAVWPMSTMTLPLISFVCISDIIGFKINKSNIKYYV